MAGIDVNMGCPKDYSIKVTVPCVSSWVPSSVLYSGTRLESKLLVFFGFSVCSHVYLLNYISELAQIWRQDTDTIHDHNHTKKKKINASAARNNGP